MRVSWSWQLPCVPPSDKIHFPGYIDEFEYIDDHRAGKIVVQLNGRINKCGVVSPRFNVQLDQIENWVDRLMPARSFGIIILVSHATIAS